MNNITCPYCQRDMNLDTVFAKMYSHSSVTNYDCSTCRYSIQIDKDQLTFGWFYCFVENEEYEIKFNFIQTISSEKVYCWSTILEIDGVAYKLDSKKKTTGLLKHSDYTTLKVMKLYNNYGPELEVPQYYPLPENNIKNFLYNLTKQLLNLKSFI